MNHCTYTITWSWDKSTLGIGQQNVERSHRPPLTRTFTKSVGWRPRFREHDPKKRVLQWGRYVVSDVRHCLITGQWICVAMCAQKDSRKIANLTDTLKVSFFYKIWFDFKKLPWSTQYHLLYAWINREKNKYSLMKRC